MYHFDCLFFDTTSPKYYDRMTLQKEALGGTEATVIRVAEGLAELGLKVCVMEARCPYFPPIMGQHCFFMHADDLEQVSCRHYIQLRGNLNPHLFPRSKKYLWLHDRAGKQEDKDAESIKANDMQVICVSRWHKKNISERLGGYDNVKYIYNPIPEALYDAPRREDYNPNLLVWTASPHKGLKKALELFKKLREKNPKFELLVFNPGYMNLDNVALSQVPGLHVYGPTNCDSLWPVIRKALCVFYPVQWDETFGLIAAEANAMGVPIATFPKAALKEVVSSDEQFAETDEELINKVLDWSQNGRPKVAGKDEFKMKSIILDWVYLLAK